MRGNRHAFLLCFVDFEKRHQKYAKVPADKNSYK